MVNPYTPPKCSDRKARPPSCAAFEVGESERHLVEIFLSLWGTEVYTVDDVEVLRLTSMSMRAVREFEVGESEKHSVEVKVDMLPSWKSFISPYWIAEVYVDGELVVDELFPRIRRRLEMMSRIFNFVLVASLAVLVILVLVMLLLFLWLG